MFQVASPLDTTRYPPKPSKKRNCFHETSIKREERPESIIRHRSRLFIYDDGSRKQTGRQAIIVFIYIKRNNWRHKLTNKTRILLVFQLKGDQ